MDTDALCPGTCMNLTITTVTMIPLTTQISNHKSTTTEYEYVSKTLTAHNYLANIVSLLELEK